jgi:hypothetical protein
MGRPRKHTFKKGDTFGSWTVIGEADTDETGHRKVECRCVCGSKEQINAQSLVDGKSVQCLSCAQGSSNSVNAFDVRARRSAHGRGMKYSLSSHTLSASFSNQKQVCALTAEPIESQNSVAVAYDNSKGLIPENTLLVSKTMGNLMGTAGMDVKTFMGLCQSVIENSVVPAQPTQKITSVEEFFNRREQQ